MTTTLSLAKTLINQASITPNDNGCQDILLNRLKDLGFTITQLPSNDVSNFYATHGDQGPIFAFSGHTDVVPPGVEADWLSPPFEASVREKKLFGRGAADMKTALAAMITATERFIKNHPKHPGQIAYLITSDEEGMAIDGTAKIMNHLKEKKIKLDWCLVGEASSQKQLGDSIKIGRRGSLHGELTVFGKQGHIAYPQYAINPIHRCFQALDELTQTEWDQGNEHFSPTSFQIYNINADTGATNVIPGSLQARFNFRFAPTSCERSLIEKTESIFSRYDLEYKINWNLSSNPFFSQKGKLQIACCQSIKEICGIDTEPNTTGGTSDGRFIAPTGTEVVELGLINESIHQVNEHADLDDIETLSTLYENILEKMLL